MKGGSEPEGKLPRAHVAVSRRRPRTRRPRQPALGSEPGASLRARPQPHLRRPRRALRLRRHPRAGAPASRQGQGRGRRPARRALGPRRATPPHLLLPGRTQPRHRRAARTAQRAPLPQAPRLTAQRLRVHRPSGAARAPRPTLRLRPVPSPAATAATPSSSLPSPRPTSSSSTTSDSPSSTPTTDATSSNSLKTDTPRAPPSSPASSPWPNGMSCSATPHSPTPSSTDSYTTLTSSNSREAPCEN